MDKRLKEISNIKLHYRHGIATVTLEDETVFGIIHSHKKAAATLYEVFVMYKAYERFIEKHGWGLLVARFAGELNIAIQGKSIGQVTKEINEALLKQSKEMDVYV